MTRTAIISDNLTGGDLTGQDDVSHEFIIDGQEYSADLSADSLAAVIEMLSGSPARMVKLISKPGAASASTGAKRTTNPDSAKAREWAKTDPAGITLCTEHDYTVTDKGKMPGWLKDGYAASLTAKPTSGKAAAAKLAGAPAA